MSTDIKWGRGIGFVPHRIQHAWRIETHGLIPLCLGPVNRATGTVDFQSDAARCERCAERMNRMEEAA